MRKVQPIVLACLLVLLLLAACAPQAAPVPAPAASVPPSALAPLPAPAAAAAAPAKPAWQLEWDKTFEAARKEGKLVLYTGIGGEQLRIIKEPFQSKYGVSVESISGGSSLLSAKVLAEQRAGIYSVDVWISGSTTYRDLKVAGVGLDSLDSVPILPDLTEPETIKKTWYFGDVPWANEAHTMFIGLMKFTEAISTNTTLVKPGEITTYRDLLDPKWKGKISLQDPQVSGMGNMWFAVVLEMGDVDNNYMRELAAKQELFVTRDRRLQVEWLARGKHAIAIAPDTLTVTEFMQLGLPINRFAIGTPFVSGSTSGISVMKNRPNPNAARLFVNWLLSQEGSTFHARAIGVQSQRLDVPTSHLEPSQILKPGLKIYRSDNEQFATKRVETYTPLAKDIFGSLTK